MLQADLRTHPGKCSFDVVWSNTVLAPAAGSVEGRPSRLLKVVEVFTLWCDSHKLAIGQLFTHCWR